MSWSRTTGRGTTKRQGPAEMAEAARMHANHRHMVLIRWMSRYTGSREPLWLLAAHHPVARSIRLWACQLITGQQVPPLSLQYVISASSKCSVGFTMHAAFAAALSDRRTGARHGGHAASTDAVTLCTQCNDDVLAQSRSPFPLLLAALGYNPHHRTLRTPSQCDIFLQSWHEFPTSGGSQQQRVYDKSSPSRR